MKNLHVTIIALACVYAVNAYAALKPLSDYDVDDYVQDGLMAQYDGALFLFFAEKSSDPTFLHKKRVLTCVNDWVWMDAIPR